MRRLQIRPTPGAARGAVKSLSEQDPEMFGSYARADWGRPAGARFEALGRVCPAEVQLALQAASPNSLPSAASPDTSPPRLLLLKQYDGRQRLRQLPLPG